MKCLIVDDSRMSRMMLTKIIGNAHSDWEILEAADGQQAVDLVKADKFDIVLLDFNMPIMDGGEAAGIIRPLLADAKIAFLTANIQEATKNLAAQLKIDFIPKPITEAKVLQYVG